MKMVLLSHYAASVINFRGPLIEDLLAQGVTVEVWAPDWLPESQIAVERLGASALAHNLTRSSTNPFSDIRSVFQLRKAFKVSKPDVVLTYAAKTNVWGTIAAFLAGVPHRVILVAGLGNGFAMSGARKMTKQYFVGHVVRFLYRFAFKAAHKVVVQNPDDARDLRRLCGLSKEKTVLVSGTGVRLEDWPFSPVQVEPLTFTLVARLLREKGILDFLEAARCVKKQNPLVRFNLLGGLDSNPSALSVADIQPWIDDGTLQWPGQVDVKQWLEKTSVFVLPSYYREGIPRSTQEALAMGRPVITTDVPGCRETVVDGVNGFLIPPQDVPALVQAMMQFVDQPDLLFSMGGESRRLAEERFDVRRINQKMLAVLGIRGSDEACL